MAAAAATRDSTIRVHVQLKLHILSIFNWLLFEIVAKTMSKTLRQTAKCGKNRSQTSPRNSIPVPWRCQVSRDSHSERKKNNNIRRSNEGLAFRVAAARIMPLCTLCCVLYSCRVIFLYLFKCMPEPMHDDCINYHYRFGKYLEIDNSSIDACRWRRRHRPRLKSERRRNEFAMKEKTTLSQWQA